MSAQPTTVATKDFLYDLREDGSIFQFLGLGKGWKELDGPNPDTMQLASSLDFLYKCHKNGALYQRVNDSWYLMRDDSTGKIASMACSVDVLYTLVHGPEGGIYRFTDIDRSGLQIDQNSADLYTVSIAAGYHTMYKLDNQGDVWMLGRGLDWAPIDIGNHDADTESIVAGSFTEYAIFHYYQILKSGEIYHHEAGHEPVKIFDGKDLKQMDTGPALVVLLRQGGSVSLYDKGGKKWVQILEDNDQVQGVAAGIDGHIYARKHDNSVIRYDSDKGWIDLK